VKNHPSKTSGLDSEIALARTVPRLNSEPAKSRKLAIELRFSSAAIRGQLHNLQRRLIGEARRALRGDHTGSGTASYSFVSEESGNLDIAIVVRHDLSPSRGLTPNTALFYDVLEQYWI
jgi:hypothetical protein